MNPKHLLHTIFCIAWLGLLTACGSPPEPGEKTPLLRLAPAALGQPIAARQQLTVKTREREFQLDVLLEADSDSVRLVLLDLGQVMARLLWDGTRLETTAVPGWPATVGGERILSDLQWMYWPVAAIRQVLPEGWNLDADGRTRILRQQGQTIIVVTRETPTRTRFVHEREGYALTVDSIPQKEAP